MAVDVLPPVWAKARAQSVREWDECIVESIYVGESLDCQIHQRTRKKARNRADRRLCGVDSDPSV